VRNRRFEKDIIVTLMIPATARTLPISSDEKLSPPYQLLLTAHNEITWYKK